MARSSAALAFKSPVSISQQSYLSDKIIPIGDRLIVPLDVPTNEDAIQLVNKLGDAVQFYKVGLELIIGGEHVKLIDHLVQRGKKVMLDGKLYDVPATVKAAMRNAAKHEVTFATVHAGSDELLKAAIEVKNGIKVLAVTLLTSIDDSDLRDLGFQVDVKKLVLSRARRALDLGCDGVISSGLEAPSLRSELGTRFLIVSPGIRPVANTDDQKRTVDVEEAFYGGADYIVVGRPITGKPDPKKAAEDIQNRISALFPKQ